MTDLSPAADAGLAAHPATPIDDERRAWIYGWLADVFTAPPTRETVAAYRGAAATVLLGELAADPALAPGIARMSGALDVDLDDDALTARLGVAFGRLFLGIGGPQTVSPYESVHRCGGRLFQAPVGEMAALLAAHDLAVAETLREPPDHLAIELALMSRLITTRHPDRAALAERLAAWVPRFCDLCIEQDTVGFWAGAALVLAAVLDGEIAPELGRNQEQFVG